MSRSVLKTDCIPSRLATIQSALLPSQCFQSTPLDFSATSGCLCSSFPLLGVMHLRPLWDRLFHIVRITLRDESNSCVLLVCMLGLPFSHWRTIASLSTALCSLEHRIAALLFQIAMVVSGRDSMISSSSLLSIVSSCCRALFRSGSSQRSCRWMKVSDSFPHLH